MDPVVIILLLWFLFTGTHTVLSHPPIREPLVARLSLRGYIFFYSSVAFATLIPLVWAFFEYRTPSVVPLPSLAQSPGIWWVTMFLMFIAVMLLVLGFSRPNPVSSLMDKSGSSAMGALRITRHPAFMGVAVMGLAHLLVNYSTIDRVFFGGLLIYPILGCAHQDWRRRQTSEPGRERYFAETSFLPFVAILQGRNKLVLREFNPIAVCIGVAAYVSIFVFHHKIVG